MHCIRSDTSDSDCFQEKLHIKTQAEKYKVSNMKEITKDTFYDFIRPYDLDDEYYFVGESN